VYFWRWRRRKHFPRWDHIANWEEWDQSNWICKWLKRYLVSRWHPRQGVPRWKDPQNLHRWTNRDKNPVIFIYKFRLMLVTKIMHFRHHFFEWGNYGQKGTSEWVRKNWMWNQGTPLGTPWQAVRTPWNLTLDWSCRSTRHGLQDSGSSPACCSAL